MMVNVLMTEPVKIISVKILASDHLILVVAKLSVMQHFTDQFVNVLWVGLAMHMISAINVSFLCII